MIPAILALVLGCAEPPGQVAVVRVEGGLDVQLDRPASRVELIGQDGAPIVAVTPPSPMARVFVGAPPLSGPLAVRADGVTHRLELPVAPPVVVEVEAPVGQGRASAPESGDVVLPAIGDAPARAALVLTAVVPSRVSVKIGGATTDVSLDAPGERVSLPVDVESSSVPVEVLTPGVSHRFSVVPVRRSADAARAAIAVVDVAFPTDDRGRRDLARPLDRIGLPGRWWSAALAAAGLGYRPRDDQAPWAWQTVAIRNDDAAAAQLLIRATVVDADGAAVPAFRARLRESDAGAVQATLRVPPGAVATASLPVFAAASELPDHGAFTRRIEVLPLGGTEPLRTVERPLYVQRGAAWASAWLVAALLASAVGWGALLLRGRRWIATARTAELVTIALFGSVTWVAGTALQIAGLGVAAVLGPFQPLLTGLADDVLRACLLGTLVVLVPRVGTAALATAIGFVMRGLTLGSFHPVDLLYLGSAVFWLEAWLWLAGCTRGAAWRDRPVEVWARLSIGLGVSNLCAAATALVVSVVFYRLYFAGWYVALMLALPGFLYVVAGCGLAVGFARALRRVEG